eukprot:scaffold2016_cov63-Phaeocystis_antarctica.AAC.9
MIPCVPIHTSVQRRIYVRVRASARNSKEEQSVSAMYSATMSARSLASQPRGTASLPRMPCSIPAVTKLASPCSEVPPPLVATSRNMCALAGLSPPRRYVRTVAGPSCTSRHGLHRVRCVVCSVPCAVCSSGAPSGCRGGCTGLQPPVTRGCRPVAIEEVGGPLLPGDLVLCHL